MAIWQAIGLLRNALDLPRDDPLLKAIEARRPEPMFVPIAPIDRQQLRDQHATLDARIAALDSGTAADFRDMTEFRLSRMRETMEAKRRKIKSTIQLDLRRARRAARAKIRSMRSKTWSTPGMILHVAPLEPGLPDFRSEFAILSPQQINRNPRLRKRQETLPKTHRLLIVIWQDDGAAVLTAFPRRYWPPSDRWLKQQYAKCRALHAE